MTPKSRKITVRITAFEFGRLTDRYPTIVDVKRHEYERIPLVGSCLFYIVTTTTAAIQNVFTQDQIAGILASELPA